MTELDAFRLETEYIKKIGRSDLKRGPLTNKSDGGEGQSGFIFSIEPKEKMRKSTKRWASQHKNHFSGKTHSEESKIKMRAAKLGKYDGGNNPNFGKRLSEKEKTKMSVAVKSSTKYIQSQSNRLKKYKLVSPCGSEIIVDGQKMLKSVCKDKNLSYYSLLEYENTIVPIFRKGHGFESEKRKNTNGWRIILSTPQFDEAPAQ